MRNQLSLVLVLILTIGCSTARTRNSDPVLRIAVDADALDRSTYARIEHALFMTGKFVVVDRNMGFKAVAHEQDIQNKSTRFGSNEKYALWGQLYGVGGIIVSTQNCQMYINWLSNANIKCTQNLILLDATTGEVISSSENDVTNSPAPDWLETVAKLIDNYPKNFIDTDHVHQTIHYDKTLRKYREEIPNYKRVPAADLNQEKIIPNE